MAHAEQRKGLFRLFSARHEYPTNWAQFLNPAPGAGNVLTLEMPPERFPFFTKGLDVTVIAVDVFAPGSVSESFTLVLTPPGGTPYKVAMAASGVLDGMYEGLLDDAKLQPVNLGKSPLASDQAPPSWTIGLEAAAGQKAPTASELEDVLLVVSYQIPS
jgi:hypothetical protein